MEFLKSVFGDKALTYAELEAALKDNKEVKIAKPKQKKPLQKREHRRFSVFHVCLKCGEGVDGLA